MCAIMSAAVICYTGWSELIRSDIVTISVGCVLQTSISPEPSRLWVFPSPPLPACQLRIPTSDARLWRWCSEVLYSSHIVSSSLPCLNLRLRAKGNEDEALNRIKHAFDALYEGTCLNDDQKDFTGQRFIYAADFRLLLTVTGRRK